MYHGMMGYNNLTQERAQGSTLALHRRCEHESQGSVASVACQECLLPTCLSISSLRSAAARCRSSASCSSASDSVNAALRDSAALSEAASSPVAACAATACAAAYSSAASSKETQRVCLVSLPGARCQECVVSMVMLQDVATSWALYALHSLL